jgi:flagellar hook-associated protein 1 FlgK
MRSTFSGIELAKRSLFSHQTALQTTGHNIANANTKGYSRQVVNLIASRPMEAIGIMRSNTPGQIGTGVEFNSITRIRERFLDNQFWNQNKFLGEWTIRKDTLEKIEAIINEPSETGIRQVMADFWNAWQELSKTPDNMTARAVVKESAQALVDAFNHTSKQLDDLAADMTDAIAVKVTQINTLTAQIAELNRQIYRIEGFGDNANDLRDQRDVLVDELSGIINIDVVEGEFGYSLTMGSLELVEGFEQLMTFEPSDMEAAFGSGDLTSGEVYGMIYSRDVHVAEYRNQLNTLINGMVQGEVHVTLPKGMVIPEGVTINGVTYSGTIEERTLTQDIETTVRGINGLHQLGYTLTDPLSTAPPLFVTRDGSANFTAGNVMVNPSIYADVELLAASARTVYNSDGEEVVVRGNNTLALLIAGLRMQKFDFNSVGSGGSVLNGGTADEYFRAVVGQLGVQADEANRNAANQQTIIDQVDARRMSVSGVSLDEEMANMIKFQHAYNAAARAMTTYDEMLDKIINGMGIVGR